MQSLIWLGRNARFILAVGCFAGLLLPQLSSVLRPYLPFFVSLVLGLSIARLDLKEIFTGLLDARRLLRLLAIVLALMPLTILIYAGIARLVGLNDADSASIILLACAPPIASAAGICFILGYNARVGLETTLLATILTPLIGPLAVSIFLPDLPQVSSLELAIRLARMIVGGFVIGSLIRLVAGGETISKHGIVFDGIAALGMLVFVIPVFDQVGAIILADPVRAIQVLLLAILVNLGVSICIIAAFQRNTCAQTAGSLGVVCGNRTIALYLAALPFNPDFSLFVALYQFPMYFTPLVLTWIGFNRLKQ
jgi:hypothetical protein